MLTAKGHWKQCHIVINCPFGHTFAWSRITGKGVLTIPGLWVKFYKETPLSFAWKGYSRPDCIHKGDFTMVAVLRVVVFGVHSSASAGNYINLYVETWYCLAIILAVVICVVFIAFWWCAFFSCYFFLCIGLWLVTVFSENPKQLLKHSRRLCQFGPHCTVHNVQWLEKLGVGWRWGVLTSGM